MVEITVVVGSVLGNDSETLIKDDRVAGSHVRP